MTQRHFVDVWNPSYASNAMEAHLAVLLAAVKRFEEGKLKTDDQVYVWWGKVRSPNRQQPLRHLAAALEIGAELEADEEREGHLYRETGTCIRNQLIGIGYAGGTFLELAQVRRR